MSSTVLRVKRKLDDNPQNAIVLLCKRIKTDQDISPNLFVFQGTVDNQENTYISHVVPKSTTLKLARDVNDVINKIRQERKNVSAHNRYEVVNCSRGLLEDENEKDKIDLVDLQISDDKCDGAQYAYDLYVAAKKDFDVSMLDNLVGIENYETELVFDSHPDNQDPDSSIDDDEDSNEENYYKNEYPDSENSIGEEDMIKAMANHNIEDDLSSDEGEDKVYNDPPTEQFSEDTKRYGVWYARYKQKVITELDKDNSLVHCNRMKEMDEEFEGYKDDSDDGFYYGQDEDSDQFREQHRRDSNEYDPD